MELKGTELKGGSSNLSYRAAGMLTVFSLLVLLEGYMRLTMNVAQNHGVYDELKDDVRNLRLAQLVGALLEIIAGVFGLIRALAVIFCDYHNPTATLTAILAMLVNWVPFIIFVFWDPAHAAHNTEKSPNPDFSLNQWLTILAIQIIGASSYCAALGGGQVFFAWQLWLTEKNQRSTYTSRYYSLRLVYYSTLALIAGVTQLVVGIIVRKKVGPGRLMPPETVTAAPFFVVYPELNITAGLLVILSAVAGYGRAVFRSASGRGFFSGLWAFTWFVQVTFMTTLQLGLFSELPPFRMALVFVTPILFAVVTSLSFLPPYMDAMMYHEETKLADEENKAKP